MYIAMHAVLAAFFKFSFTLVTFMYSASRENLFVDNSFLVNDHSTCILISRYLKLDDRFTCEEKFTTC